MMVPDQILNLILPKAEMIPRAVRTGSRLPPVASERRIETVGRAFSFPGRWMSG
jgi:hypothetical protein